MTIQVDVTNATRKLAWQNTFDSQAAADAWIADQSEKGYWGSPERWVGPELDGTYFEDITKATDQRTNDAGQIEYHFASDFTVSQVDISAQVAQQTAVQDRSKARRACLQVIDQIAALNTTGGASDAQMDALFASPDMIAINLALLTGAPATAARKIAVVGPNLFPQAEVDKIVAALNAIK